MKLVFIFYNVLSSSLVKFILNINIYSFSQITRTYFMFCGLLIQKKLQRTHCFQGEQQKQFTLLQACLFAFHSLGPCHFNMFLSQSCKRTEVVIRMFVCTLTSLSLYPCKFPYKLRVLVYFAVFLSDSCQSPG